MTVAKGMRGAAGSSTGVPCPLRPGAPPLNSDRNISRDATEEKQAAATPGRLESANPLESAISLLIWNDLLNARS